MASSWPIASQDVVSGVSSGLVELQQLLEDVRVFGRVLLQDYAGEDVAVSSAELEVSMRRRGAPIAEDESPSSASSSSSSSSSSSASQKAPHEAPSLPSLPSLLASQELACISGISSACSLLPSAATDILLCGVNIGPFSWWTFALSSLCCAVLSVQAPLLSWKHKEVGRRQLFRALSGATAIAAAGQAAFLILNQPSIPLIHFMPHISVSSLFAPMMNPFLVLHLFAHSTELPLMIYSTGRLAGKTWKDMSFSTINVGIYSMCSIVAAASHSATIRYPMLALGTWCLSLGLHEVTTYSRSVDNLAPPNLPRTNTWGERIRICATVLQLSAYSHPLLLAGGFVGYVPQAMQMDIFAILDTFMTAGLANFLLRDMQHVSRAEIYLVGRERGRRPAIGS